MKRNYRVFIENGSKEDSFTMLGESRKAVRSLCEIVHLGTGWVVKNVELALKKDNKNKRRVRQMLLF